MADKPIDEMPDIKKQHLEKLKEAGIDTIMKLAIARIDDITTIEGIGDITAKRLIEQARQLADIGNFKTGDRVFEERKKIKKITTMSKSLDELLGGGIETGAITEFYGGFSSGKTQICHQVLVNVQLSEKDGGLEKEGVIIDTENTFRPERIVSIAKALNLDGDKALKKIFVARAYNSDHQMLWVNKVSQLAREKQIGLLVVDSLTAHFRAEYIGRGTLADRQQHINKHLHDLLRFAELNNSAIVVTNQAVSDPSVMFGDPTRHVGGHIVGHTTTYRVYLRKSKENKRIARLVDSPCMPEGDAVFSLNEEGIRD